MALLYQKQVAGSDYQVRSAGASLRLYSNGVLHSQYNPNTPINGTIWDLLLLPGFFKGTAPKHILVLGLGGGTIVHLLKVFFPESFITCVELDKEHIHIAKKHFLIPAKQVKVVHGDAYEFLRRTTQKFDWIMDDVFQHVLGEPLRGKSVKDIFPLYSQCLNKQGMLSANLIGAEQYQQMKYFSEQFGHGYQFNHPMYENRIICLSDDMCSTAQFRLNLKQFKELDQSRKTCKLNYRLRKL
jgi:spermidine synthase